MREGEFLEVFVGEKERRTINLYVSKVVYFMAKKEIKVFIYGFNVPNNYYSNDLIKKQFSKSNIIKNIVSYGDDALLLIIDSGDEDFLFGRCLILRKDVPSILNTQTQQERDMTLSKNENVKEESHFLISLKDKLLFGEYNYHSVRHFSYPLMYYFKKTLMGSPIDIRPNPNPKTMKLLKQNKNIKDFEFSIGQERLSHKEQSGIPLIGSLLGLSTNNESCIKIKVTSGRKKENELDSDKIIQKLENLKDSKSDDLYSLKVQTEQGKYDLLNGNLIHFNLQITQLNKRTNRADFYRKIKLLYNQKISIIKNLLR